MIKKIVAACLLLGLATQLQSQEIFVSYEAADKPLSQIFKDLEKNYDVYFAFSPGQIKGKKASIQVDSLEINDFLARVLKPHKLIYELYEEKYISVKTPESVYLRAQVFDGETGQTLPFATARLKDTYLGGVADQDGRFRLFIDEPLDAKMEFSFLGYDSQELDLNSYQSGEEIRITLQPETQTLKRIVIKEYVSSGISSDEKASSFKIRPQEMAVLPGLSERDVMLSAQIISGINSNDETASGLNVRGSARDNTFIYWNNIPMYQSAHYFGNISSFIPSSIGEVDIYKNYVPVKYGGASSGLMKMTSRAENNGERDFEVSLNMTHLDVYAQLPFKNDFGAVMIAARRSYNDLWATPTFNAFSDKVFEGSFTQDLQTSLNPDFRYNSSINFGDINFQWLYEPSNRSTWRFSALYSGSAMNYDSQFAFGFGDESWFQNHNVTNLGANLTWNYRMSDNLSSEVSLSAASYELDYGLSIDFEDEEEDDEDEEDDDAFSERDAIFNNVSNLELRSSFAWKLSAKHFLNFGYQLNLLSAEINIRDENFFEEDQQINTVTEGLINAVFGELLWDPTEKLEVIGALRFNHYGPSADLVTDAQLRINYDLTDMLVLKMATGNYNQYLTAVQDGEFSFSNTVEQHWIMADDDESIPIVSAWQSSLGFLFTKDDWLIDFDFYTKTMDGILARNMGFSYTENDGLDAGSDEIFGVDLTVMKKWDNLRLWASYNFQDSQLSFDSPDLQPSPFPSSFNIRHQLQAATSYTTGLMEFSLGYTYKTGLPWTPALGVELVLPDDPDDDDEEAFYEIIEGDPNSARQPDYHRVDASAWYKFGSSKGKKWAGEIGLSLLNVFNIRNVGRRTFDIDGDETNANVTPSLITIDQILLGFSPNLTLRFRF